MYDDNDDGFEILFGLFLLAPVLVCLWFKFTFMLLGVVFQVIAGIVMFVCYVIKRIIVFFIKLGQKKDVD